MNRFRKTREGYKYALTELGLNFSHVRAKYNCTHNLYKQYQHSAPVAWFEKGYIVEVKDSGENKS